MIFKNKSMLFQYVIATSTFSLVFLFLQVHICLAEESARKSWHPDKYNRKDVNYGRHQRSNDAGR